MTKDKIGRDALIFLKNSIYISNKQLHLCPQKNNLLYFFMENKYRVPFSAMGIVLAIGIVFGDIGTSPLYVMRAVIHTLPDGQLARPEYIMGAVSCVIWTLSILTTLKYVIFTL